MDIAKKIKNLSDLSWVSNTAKNNEILPDHMTFSYHIFIDSTMHRSVGFIKFI